jgi:23S rRNA (adenine2503-C2)-methyltransferase
MDLHLLEETLAAHGEPPFRARQVWEWTARGAGSYEEMTNLPLALRESLEREVPFSSLALRAEARADDGTVKALFATADGRPLEAVLMRYQNPPGGRNSPSGSGGRRSVCVSSQSGCPLTCTFCATGAMKFGRNLSVSEIVDQVLHFQRVERGSWRGGQSRPARSNSAPQAQISNCVFMGMGEPMLNLDNVLGACERLPSVGITHRRTAISTVGWIPGIERLAECDLPVRLALSLHAADDALRSQLMPVNERHPLADVIEACHAFYARKRRRVFVEYVMLAGVNDRHEQALALAKVLGPRRDGRQVFKVNLIPYNPTESRYEGSGRQSIAAFRDALLERGVEATVRLTRGRDIDAACGQLAAKVAPLSNGETPAGRLMGELRGRIVMSDDFDEPDEEIERLFGMRGQS